MTWFIAKQKQSQTEEKRKTDEVMEAWQGGPKQKFGNKFWQSFQFRES